MNLVEPTKLSPTLESRLLKHAFRGFRVAVPGFAPELRVCLFCRFIHFLSALAIAVTTYYPKSCESCLGAIHPVLAMDFPCLPPLPYALHPALVAG